LRIFFGGRQRVSAPRQSKARYGINSAEQKIFCFSLIKNFLGVREVKNVKQNFLRGRPPAGCSADKFDFLHPSFIWARVLKNLENFKTKFDKFVKSYYN